jgi:DNA replication and repair protein RecF
MFLLKLYLNDFRNYSQSELIFNRKGNLFFGGNGQGKTNLLESIYFLSIFRSFKKGTSKNLVRWGTRRFNVSGLFETKSGIERSIAVEWAAGQKKHVFYENERVKKVSDLVGFFPVVILSPESMEITQGQPLERRRFLDLCISIVDREYLQHLISYNRTLKQRNKLLALSESYHYGSRNGLDVWDEKLVFHGSFVIMSRLKAMKQLSDICVKQYASISSGGENLSLEYKSTVPDLSIVEKSFKEQIGKMREEEFRKRVTLVGPHRDDITFCLDGHDVRRYASQGQHKTILLSLKSAELQFVSGLTGIQPAILVDDLFALLDEKRILEFLKILRGYGGQFFITANKDIKPGTLISKVGFQSSDFSQYSVEKGTITAQ